MKRIIPCVFITLALIFAGSFLPILGFIGLILCPLPLAVLGCVEGQKPASIAELMIEATLFFVVSPTMAVYFLIGCAPFSGMMYLLSREDFKEAKKYSGAETLLICAGVSILAKVILLVVYWLFTGRNILFPDSATLEIVLSQLYGQDPELLAMVRQVLGIFPYMLPAMLMIYCGIESFMNYTLCSTITRKLFPSTKNYPPELPEFKLWRFPVSLLAVSALSLLAGYFIDSDTWFEGSMFVMNLQIVINIFMFIEGVSLAFWLMSGFKLRRGAKIFISIILTIPFFWPWLIVMGMCDMVLNMRERIKFGA